jgi:hypothetical protein
VVADGVTMGTSGNQDGLVSMLKQPTSDHSSDGSGTEHDEAHRPMLAQTL